MLEDYKSAVFQNDVAHRKTIVERVTTEATPVEQIMQEVGAEANMWLDHIEFTHQQGKYSPSQTRKIS